MIYTILLRMPDTDEVIDQFQTKEKESADRFVELYDFLMGDLANVQVVIDNAKNL